MKIQIGDYEVYAEGTIVSLPDLPVKFLIEDLTFELIFIDEPSSNEQKLTAKASETGKGISLTFTNFNNSLGTSNVKPLPLGFIKNQTLFFNYRIHALNSEPNKGKLGKTIHYTWLLKEREVQDGQ